MRPVETLPVASWMQDPAPTAVFAALSAGRHVGRFVGGAVRNYVLGLPVTDFDIACDAEPMRVIELGRSAGLKSVPTGIEHGTVTLVVPGPEGGTPVEVTTLRRDVETDGRRAVVAFTDDWAEDAARRDFTMNALYLDADGALYDPTARGLSDARVGRVRFVGDPETRILEDVLRALRFFRFLAAYGRGEPDAEGLSACAAQAPRLASLSGERVWGELRKLLAAPRAADTLVLMAEAGIARHLWDGPVDAGRAAALVELEGRHKIPPDPVRRLAALVAEPDGAAAVADRLRLSRSETRRLEAALATPGETPGGQSARRSALYRYGIPAWVDARLLRAAETGEDVGKDLQLAVEWAPPVFPLGGADVTALGVAPGPQVGDLLRAVETWWIAQDFAGDADTCRAELRRRVFEGGGDQ